MPINKNALIRYRILDECLSDPNRRYSRQDLTDHVNSVLTSIDDEAAVSKRAIEKDLVALTERPFELDIVEENFHGKRVVRYSDQTRTLFNKPLSNDEKILLKEVLNTLGQFSGLDNFEWVSELQKKLNDSSSFGDEQEAEQRTIISFSRNPYLNNLEDTLAITNSLSLLFTAISRKITVKVDYKRFGGSMEEMVVYPYLLKQFNDRWYLICRKKQDSPSFIINLPLDRMFGVDFLTDVDYIDCEVDLEERFSQIVGVTYRYDLAEEEILFAVGNGKADYIRTKPVHESQRELPSGEQTMLRTRYPSLGDYSFFEVSCIPNNELKTLLFSFDKDIVLISPENLKTEMISELERLMKLYSGI